VSNRCPYCQGENFYPEATEKEGGFWVNRCTECGQYSQYNEATGEQESLPENERAAE